MELEIANGVERVDWRNERDSHDVLSKLRKENRQTCSTRGIRILLRSMPPILHTTATCPEPLTTYTPRNRKGSIRAPASIPSDLDLTKGVSAVSGVGSAVKGKERRRVRRMRRTSRRKEERREERKQEKNRTRASKSYDKKQLRRRITNS
jgi:hypothetical protein